MKYFKLSILLVSIVFIIVYVSGGNDKAVVFNEQTETKADVEKWTPENLIDDAAPQFTQNQVGSFVFDESSMVDISEQLQNQIKTKALQIKQEHLNSIKTTLEVSTEEEQNAQLIQSQQFVDALSQFAANSDWDAIVAHVNAYGSGDKALLTKALLTAAMLDAPFEVFEDINVTNGINSAEFAFILSFHDKYLPLIQKYDEQLGIVSDSNNYFMPFKPIHAGLFALDAPQMFAYLLKSYPEVTSINSVTGTNILGHIIIESTKDDTYLQDAIGYIDIYKNAGYEVDKEALRVLEMIKANHPKNYQIISEKLGIGGGG